RGIEPWRAYTDRPKVSVIEAFTKLRRFIAVKLQQIRLYDLDDVLDLLCCGIHEQGHDVDERGNRRPQFASLLEANRPPAVGIHDEPNSISPCLHCRMDILEASQPANLDT